MLGVRVALRVGLKDLVVEQNFVSEKRIRYIRAVARNSIPPSALALVSWDMRKNYRKWFRFSMRSLLMVVTVLCLWIGYEAKEMQDRRASVAAVDAIGGASNIRVEGPGWLRKLIGDEKAFYNVGSVSLTPSHTDYELIINFDNELRGIIPHLNDFSHFYKLNLASSPITDKGLEYLKDLTRLEKLILNDTEVSDTGLGFLGKIETLEYLNIRNTKVTQNGIAKFQKALPNCKVVWKSEFDRIGFDRIN